MTITIRDQLRLYAKSVRLGLRRRRCQHPEFRKTLRGELGKIYLEYYCLLCGHTINEKDVLEAQKRRPLKKGAS